MNSINETRLEFNRRLKNDFNGGDFSSDAGLVLIREFAKKIGIHEVIEKQFKTNDAVQRRHTDAENLLQMIYQKIAGHFWDDDTDELTEEPGYPDYIFNKECLSI